MSARLGALTGVRMICADPERLAAFYVEAFGFERLPPRHEDAAALGRLLGAERAEVVRLHLGQQEVELVGTSPAGRPYPAGVGAADTIFQHIALIVPDMAAAMSRLERAGRYAAISEGGPQALPESSGGVTAYKFRDPEGHPLEFLQFPAGKAPAAWAAPGASDATCLGFDHSAIVVADTAASLAWYARLGLKRGEGSLNTGPEQERLDAVPGVTVEVTGLEGGMSPPHVELLCYRGETARGGAATADDDAAATQLVFSIADETALRELVAAVGSDAEPVDLGENRAALLRDPDGHRLWLRTDAGDASDT